MLDIVDKVNQVVEQQIEKKMSRMVTPSLVSQCKLLTHLHTGTHQTN